jgi:hypothetical protein
MQIKKIELDHSCGKSSTGKGKRAAAALATATPRRSASPPEDAAADAAAAAPAMSSSELLILEVVLVLLLLLFCSLVSFLHFCLPITPNHFTCFSGASEAGCGAEGSSSSSYRENPCPRHT